MKKFTVTIFLSFLALFNFSYSQIGMGFFGGLSTPNDKFSDVYNSNTINLNAENVIGNFLSSGMNSGYHFGAKVRIPMSDNFLFNGGVSWHRFPETAVTLGIPGVDTLDLKINQNIIPIAAGIQFYLMKSMLSLYATGELTYNYLSSTVEYPTIVGSVPLNFDSTPTDSRVGFGLGFGLDIDIKVVLLNIEGKYNYANLIGQKGDEKAKAYYTLSLGIYFGSSLPGMVP